MKATDPLASIELLVPEAEPASAEGRSFAARFRERAGVSQSDAETGQDFTVSDTAEPAEKKDTIPSPPPLFEDS